jgi:hypothetical protein
MDPRNDRTRHWLTASLATAIAVALGASLGWWLRGGTTQAASLPPAPATGVTREEIEGLKRDLLARLDELTRVRASITPASADADDQVIELGRRIEALESRVALARQKDLGGPTGELWTPPKGPGSGSIDAIVERIQASYRGEHALPEGESLSTQLRKEHELWTFEDVVRAYGAPRRWRLRESAWLLFYGCFDVEGSDQQKSIRFRLRGGYLSDVEEEGCEP